MNLHAIVAGQIGAVNPHVPLVVRISVGSAEQADASVVPIYATPGTFDGAIVGNLLTVTAQTAGKLLVGQTISGPGVLDDTRIEEDLTGNGGPGTYSVTNIQTVGPISFASELVVPGQVQPVSWRDLQQLDALNLQGTRYKIYFYGNIDAIIRPDNKGGDMVTDPLGRVFLVAMVAEAWKVWCAVFATLQDGA